MGEVAACIEIDDCHNVTNAWGYAADVPCWANTMCPCHKEVRVDRERVSTVEIGPRIGSGGREVFLF